MGQLVCSCMTDTETAVRVAEVTEPAAQAPFSLALTDEQKEIRDWVHGFSQNVIRPAASEWDEREETPWPVIQEAAKIVEMALAGRALRAHIGLPFDDEFNRGHRRRLVVRSMIRRGPLSEPGARKPGSSQAACKILIFKKIS